MQVGNKNIRKNILQLVCNRVNPQTSGINLQRTSCQSCLILTDSHGNKQKKKNKIKCSTKDLKHRIQKQSRLQICSGVVQENFQSSQQRRPIINADKKKSSIINLIKQQKEKRQCKQNSHIEIDEQQISNSIIEWVNYAIAKLNGTSLNQVEFQQTLPYQSNQRLRQLKQKINQQINSRKLQPRDSLYSECQTYDSVFFKKPSKDSSLTNPIQPANDRNLTTDKIPNQKMRNSQLSKKLTYSNTQPSSIKLLHSTSTISSQKYMLQQTEQHMQDLTRMLFLQAVSIQQFINY